MAVTKVVMPKLSDAMESGKIIKWLKKEGDRINGGDILAEVETDKADVEMEAFGAGVLRKILVPAGENAAEARRHAGDLPIIPVENFRQALRALATFERKQ